MHYINKTNFRNLSKILIYTINDYRALNCNRAVRLLGLTRDLRAFLPGLDFALLGSNPWWCGTYTPSGIPCCDPRAPAAATLHRAIQYSTVRAPASAPDPGFGISISSILSAPPPWSESLTAPPKPQYSLAASHRLSSAGKSASCPWIRQRIPRPLRTADVSTPSCLTSTRLSCFLFIQPGSFLSSSFLELRFG